MAANGILNIKALMNTKLVVVRGQAALQLVSIHESSDKISTTNQAIQGVFVSIPPTQKKQTIFPYYHYVRNFYGCL